MRHLYVLWGLVALLAATSVFALVRVQEVQHHQNDALRSIICHAEKVVRTTPDLSAEQRARAIRFYRSSLSAAHLAPCDE